MSRINHESHQKGGFYGDPGDGVIFIYPVDNVIRISTDEEGNDALMYQGDIDSVSNR